MLARQKRLATDIGAPETTGDRYWRARNDWRPILARQKRQATDIGAPETTGDRYWRARNDWRPMLARQKRLATDVGAPETTGDRYWRARNPSDIATGNLGLRAPGAAAGPCIRAKKSECDGRIVDRARPWPPGRMLPSVGIKKRRMTKPHGRLVSVS